MQIIKYRKLFFQITFIFLLGIPASLILTSCRSTKKITSAIGKKDTLVNKTDTMSAEDLHADSMRYIRTIYARLLSNHVNCSTFSAKLKVHYEGSDGKDFTVNAFVHVQVDKKIWLSIVHPVFGNEVLRVMITPDSVKVMNKPEKVYQLRSVGYLQNIAHLPFNFYDIQATILGNPIYLDSNILYYRTETHGISILSLGEMFRNYLTLTKEDMYLMHSKLDDLDPLKARSCDITYGDFEKMGDISFPTYRKVSVVEKARLDVELNFKNVRFNETLDYPFTIPKNYKRN